MKRSALDTHRDLILSMHLSGCALADIKLALSSRVTPKLRRSRSAIHAYLKRQNYVGYAMHDVSEVIASIKYQRAIAFQNKITRYTTRTSKLEPDRALIRKLWERGYSLTNIQLMLNVTCSKSALHNFIRKNFDARS